MKPPPANDGYLNLVDVDVLNSRRLPARLEFSHVARLLNFQVYELQILCRVGLLSPLGRPAQNSRKFFSRDDILALASNRNFLHKATLVIAREIQRKNAKAELLNSRDTLAGNAQRDS